MKNKKFAFTLVEMIITIGIIGIIVATLIPILHNIMPGKDKGLVRKSYYIVKNTINLLLNDPVLYPTDKFLKGDSKDAFITNFKSYLKTNDTLTATDEHFATTADGMDWYQSGSWTDTSDYGVILYVDINGADQTPNCTQYTSNPSGYSVCPLSVKPDTYAFGIRYDGKISIFADSQIYMNQILSDPTDIKKSSDSHSSSSSQTQTEEQTPSGEQSTTGGQTPSEEQTNNDEYNGTGSFDVSIKFED